MDINTVFLVLYAVVLGVLLAVDQHQKRLEEKAEILDRFYELRRNHGPRS